QRGVHDLHGDPQPRVCAPGQAQHQPLRRPRGRRDPRAGARGRGGRRVGPGGARRRPAVAMMMNDLRYAVRQLARSPGFTAVALLALALGIGACAAIFSVVNSVLLRPIPFPDSERLVVVKETLLPPFPEFPVSSGHYFDWREQAQSFESLSALQLVDGVPGRAGSYALTGMGEPVRVSAA